MTVRICLPQGLNCLINSHCHSEEQGDEESQTHISLHRGIRNVLFV